MAFIPWEAYSLWVRASEYGGSRAEPLPLRKNMNPMRQLSKHAPYGPKNSLRNSRLDIPAFTPGRGAYFESGKKGSVIDVVSVCHF